METTYTYAAQDVSTFATTLLVKAGMPADKAATVASILVEGELSGRSTHGLALLAPYLDQIAIKSMQVEGEPDVINDFGACLTWDGKKLPGPWLITRALAEAKDRAARFGIGAVSIRRSHHTASLGAYLKAITDEGYVAFITLTDPGFSSVAPFGGLTPVLTSNPFAFGAPNDDIPVIVDCSTSLATNGMVAKMHREGRQFDTPTLLDAQGNPSCDPAVITTNPPGSILPLGGLQAGHKGYGIGMMIEVLSGCISGYGRGSPNEGWSASVFILVMKPEAFAGADAFKAQMQALAAACHNATPRPGFGPVKLPGESSNIRRKNQLQHGMTLPPALLAAWQPWIQKFNVSLPAVSPISP